MSETARSDATGTSMTESPVAHAAPKSRKELTWLSLGALGVVYGDIGTSPLYAMRECFAQTNPHHVDRSCCHTRFDFDRRSSRFDDRLTYGKITNSYFSFTTVERERAISFVATPCR